MRYNFSLWTNPPLTSVNTRVVTTAAKVAVFALQIDNTKVQPVVSSTGVLFIYILSCQWNMISASLATRPTNHACICPAHRSQISPAKTTQKIDGIIQTVWDISLRIEFPKNFGVDLATSALSTVSFATDLVVWWVVKSCPVNSFWRGEAGAGKGGVVASV